MQNKLLAALPEIEWKRVQQYLSFVEWPAGTAICHSGLQLDHAYFPTTSIISVLNAGLIASRRGHISVIDRGGIEAHTCECYRVVRRAYDRLPAPYPYSLCSASPIPSKSPSIPAYDDAERVA